MVALMRTMSDYITAITDERGERSLVQCVFSVLLEELKMVTPDHLLKSLQWLHIKTRERLEELDTIENGGGSGVSVSSLGRGLSTSISLFNEVVYFFFCLFSLLSLILYLCAIAGISIHSSSL